jgi:hypothetical protein
VQAGDAARGLVWKAHAPGHAVNDVLQPLMIRFDLARLSVSDEHMRGGFGREG